jgi:hypothetical protein
MNIVADLKLPNIFVDLSVTPAKSGALGKAEYKTRVITLYPGGMTVGTLLHEIAHLMPNGYDHGSGWQFNFSTLAKHYMNNEAQYQKL